MPENCQQGIGLAKSYKFGIEHEVAFWDQTTEQFADFSNLSFKRLINLISQLPEYESDHGRLRVNYNTFWQKRWYVEGFDRFSTTGKLTHCTPKGIEIRTTPQPTILRAMQELRDSFSKLCEVANSNGLIAVLTSFNPIKTTFIYNPPLNFYEIRRRASSQEESTADFAMLTYGPDLNFSIQDLSTTELIRVGQKLTYYSPSIVPFSFSSPFYNGKLWNGLSVRTYLRTGLRSAVRVFVEKSSDLIPSIPILTKTARIPIEVGRIEFKAFDSCGNFWLYAGLLALIKGIALDQTLPGLALIPDVEQHRKSALYGFNDPYICAQAITLLSAADKALEAPQEKVLLHPLWRLAQHQKPTLAQVMIDRYQAGESLFLILRSSYNFED